jgi:AcrR family transcriptional regulator
MKPVSATRPSPRVERTQQALVESLLELIVEKGYDRTTVEDVLRRADVGRTAFYDHFENKQDLLLRRIGEIPWLRTGPGQQNAHAITFDATFLFGHLADQRELIAALRGTPILDEAFARLRDQLLASVTHSLPARANAADDTRLQLTAQALTGALMQLLLWWLAADMPETPATMATWFAQLAERMVDD